MKCEGCEHACGVCNKGEYKTATVSDSPELPGYVRLPTIPTKDLLALIAVQRWPKDMEAGKIMQRELGIGVVPPNAEMEMAAGIYKKLIDALRAHNV